MTTDLPYAADAEVSLSFDELEVRWHRYLSHIPSQLITNLRAGPPPPIPEGVGFGPYHCPDEVQLCVGPGEEPDPRASGGGCASAARCVRPPRSRVGRSVLSVVCVEIYREEPLRRRECLYYLALGHYKMGNFDEARRFNGALPCSPTVHCYTD